MSVIYKVITRPTDPRVPNSPKRYYPHLITLGQSVNLKYIAQKMQDRSSLSVGDIKSVIQNFVEKMKEQLLEGKSVNIEGLGVFMLTARSKGAELAKDINAKSVESVRIFFQANKELRVTKTATRADEKLDLISLDEYLKKLNASVTPNDPDDGENGGGGNEGGDPEDPKFPIIMDDNRNYAYLFEDQWPLYGDYDMNDLVLIIKERKISINKDNKAEEFTLSLDLSAAGATKSIGAAIMLDGIPASAITQPVVFSDNSLAKNFNVNSNKIENGQDYAVIPLFDDAHNALGRDRYEQINTIAGHSANTSPKNISFTIKFSNPISVDELNINKLNVFIFVEGNRNQRKEIHIVGYQPTKLANTDLFGGNNDDSSTSRKRYYISKDNLAWGIMVPTDFKWPLEYVNIKSAYSLFESWVTSGGTKNEEWWKTFDSSRVYK